MKIFLVSTIEIEEKSHVSQEIDVCQASGLNLDPMI